MSLGLRHSFPSRIAALREHAAAARVGEARVAFLPDFAAGVSENHYRRTFNEDYYLGSGVIGDDALTGSSRTADASASYVLLSTTRRLELASAQASRAAFAANAELAKRAVIRDVARAYLQVVEADALLRLADQDVSRRTRGLEEAQALVRAGKRADFEVLRAEAELASAEASLVDARNGVRLRRAQLAQVVGTELPLEFVTEAPAPPADPRGNRSGAAGARALVSDVMPRRPDVRSAASEAEAAKLGLSRSNRRYLPTLSVYGRYSHTLDPSRFDPFVANLSYGGQLEVRFSDMLANAYRSSSARAEWRIAEVAADQTRVAAALDIERASLELDRAIEVSAATMKSLDAARRNYESTAERYRLGVASQTERVDAETALVEAEVNSAKADVGLRSALWNVRYEMGEPLEQ